MGGSPALISSAAVIAALVSMLVDGSLAVPVAAVALGIGLTPSAVAVAGGPGFFVLAAAALGAVLAGRFARIAGRRLPWVVGLDPSIAAFAPRQRLFGTRSVRVVAAALAVPAASWVSSNMPVGEIAAVSGQLFPVAYVWVCAALRLVVARNVEDLAVAAVMVSMAGATGWLIRAGPDAVRGAAELSALTPAAAIVSGWLVGRHRRRVPPASAVPVAGPAAR